MAEPRMDGDWPMLAPVEVKKPSVEVKRDDFGHRSLVRQALEEGPPEWMLEDRPRLKWEVQCFTGNGKPASSAVWVIAADHDRAIKAGKYWMRVVGIKRRGTVQAKRYHPHLDPAIRMWVTRVPDVCMSQQTNTAHARGVSASRPSASDEPRT
jgi:hypothetical protein